MSEDDEHIEAKRQINLITRSTFDEISRMGYSLNGKALSHEIELKTKEQDKKLKPRIEKLKVLSSEPDRTIRIRSATLERLQMFSSENFPGKNSTYELLTRLIDAYPSK